MLHKLNGKAGRGNGQTPRANTPDINPGQNPLTRTKPPSVKANIHIFIPSIHCSMGSAPVGVQCPLTSSLYEFPGYWDWLWYPRLSPVLVSNAFPFTFHIWVFSIHSSSRAIGFH